MIQINTVSTVDAVRNALETDILSLHFAPGEKIREVELASRYGVSRNTVREAVAHLLAQGLLTKEVNKGVSVRKFTVADVQEIFHLRSMLEMEAVRSIIQNSADIAKLYDIASALEQINRVDNWDEYVKNDILFHSTLVASAGSPRLSRLYENILTEVKLCIYQTKTYVAVPPVTNISHRMILDAVSQQNIESSLTLLQQHIEHVIKRYTGGLIAMSKDRE